MHAHAHKWPRLQVWVTGPRHTSCDILTLPEQVGTELTQKLTTMNNFLNICKRATQWSQILLHCSICLDPKAFLQVEIKFNKQYFFKFYKILVFRIYILSFLLAAPVIIHHWMLLPDASSQHMLNVSMLRHYLYLFILLWVAKNLWYHMVCFWQQFYLHFHITSKQTTWNSLQFPSEINTRGSGTPTTFIPFSHKWLQDQFSDLLNLLSSSPGAAMHLWCGMLRYK